MKKMAFISFILPAYKKKFLKEAIDSILAQSYSDFELVIVDDASPENLEQVISTYNDNRIRYFKNEKNIGDENLVRQWTHCIGYARGEYLVLAADDDVYHPDFLKECVRLAEKYPQVDLVRSRVEQIDKNGDLIGIDGILPEYCLKYGLVFYWMRATAYTCIGNYMFRTSVLKEKGFVDFPCAFGSDTASAVAMAENGVANTSEMLFKFRISSIHLSNNKGRLKEKLEANTLLFKWLSALNYERPKDRVDLFYYNQIQWNDLYLKCNYDYFNVVIKNLPFSKIGWIRKCELLSGKDKMIMALRFILCKIEKLFKFH
ncbi:MAG: glycosyltransferase [Candidatus Symbiothrix sp.]|jgi:glycosyltransferase involved in cell wall biosynthesis|nr:glycosyltransferase [Candidatus Symbiothrix sp.]